MKFFLFFFFTIKEKYEAERAKEENFRIDQQTYY